MLPKALLPWERKKIRCRRRKEADLYLSVSSAFHSLETLCFVCERAELHYLYGPWLLFQSLSIVWWPINELKDIHSFCAFYHSPQHFPALSSMHKFTCCTIYDSCIFFIFNVLIIETNRCDLLKGCNQLAQHIWMKLRSWVCVMLCLEPWDYTVA